MYQEAGKEAYKPCEPVYICTLSGHVDTTDMTRVYRTFYKTQRSMDLSSAAHTCEIKLTCPVIHRRQQGLIYKAGMSKHRLLPYNAYYHNLSTSKLHGSHFHIRWNMHFKPVNSARIDTVCKKWVELSRLYHWTHISAVKSKLSLEQFLVMFGFDNLMIPDVLEELTYLEPLSKCDNVCISWHLCFTNCPATVKLKYNYWKADCPAIREMLSDINL